MESRRKPLTPEQQAERRRRIDEWVAYERMWWWDMVARGHGMAARRWNAPEVSVLDASFGTLGVRGTTPTHVKRWPCGAWEVRCGIAIMGYAADSTGWDSDPFAEDFRDNYVSGTGASLEEALAALKVSGMEVADSLFA